MPKREAADELNSVGITTAARVLGVSRETLYSWASKGKVKAYRIAGKRGRTGKLALRILRTDLERLKREREKR